MDEIARLRDKIDRIDQEILVRLKARMETAQYIGQAKRARGLPIRAWDRERQILKRIGSDAQELGLNPRYAQALFRDVLRLGINVQLEHSKPFLSGVDCLVIGGTGEMGRLFVRILKNQGAQVKIVGHRSSTTRRVARQMGGAAARIKDAGSSRIVIVSVPIEHVVTVAQRAASFMKEGSLLIDISSVKKGIADRIAGSISPTIEYVSLHPLFGPQALTVHSQNMLVLPYRQGPVWNQLSTALKGTGLVLSETTADKHDRAMSYAQVMHHFALVTLGTSLGEWNGDGPTNSLRMTLDRIRKVVENRSTIASIQKLNPYAPSARAHFLADAQGLSRSPEAFGEALDKLPQHVQKWSRKH